MKAPLPIRLLLVDDEPLARERARRLLEKIGGVEIVAEAATGLEAIDAVEREQPDVVLLDIQMPGLDGLRVLEALDDPPAVIFSTAYEHHAVKAFELDALDYLLKPYSAERLARALERVRRSVGVSVPGSQAEPARIPALDGLTTELLEPEEIVAARIEEGVVFVFRRDGERLIFEGGLQELEERLARARFFRVSRQALVNLNAIESLTPADGGGVRVELAGGVEETASRRRVRYLRAALGT